MNARSRQCPHCEKLFTARGYTRHLNTHRKTAMSHPRAKAMAGTYNIPTRRDKLIHSRLKSGDYPLIFRHLKNGNYWVVRGTSLIGFVWKASSTHHRAWRNSKHRRTYPTRQAAGEAL